ncbi:SCE4755 family polysaccharide monooxygenase-like protein [Dokdonella sp.]|uniref:SCE4755 family polysaccharide monooxygenase-like protein n=1 Tax=Dokdonella sp. TaxID=2291710 RepID=UPI002F401325
MALFAAPTIASAHFDLVSPTSRYETTLFGRPCGQDPDTGRANVTTLSAGSTITVRWTSTITHPGHYRISFDADGQDFSVPGAPDDFYSDPNVVADDIASVGETDRTIALTLPDIECDNCTIQLLQVLTDHLPYTTDVNTNDLHWQCADVVLVRDGIFAHGFEAAMATIAGPDAIEG